MNQLKNVLRSLDACAELTIEHQHTMALFGRLASIPCRHPVAFGCGFSCLKTSSADLICQTQIEGTEWKDVDWRRTSIFGLWGLGYLGGVQYFLYTFAFPRAFPGVVKFVEAPLRAKLRDSQGLKTLIKQVGFDQFVHHPFVVFPAFYLIKEWVEGGTVSAGLTKCKDNWTRDCTTGLKPA